MTVELDSFLLKRQRILLKLYDFNVLNKMHDSRTHKMKKVRGDRLFFLLKQQQRILLKLYDFNVLNKMHFKSVKLELEFGTGFYIIQSEKRTPSACRKVNQL
jgi:hypothetical protein